ncbi:MAG: dTDP-Rha--alpha-D-GlcNAc-pyrophosphate polyprenol alpha-3-L-rhamnosyltransferase [Flammeovirgaceae bacterium]|nr:dTDP-Rha--alpha-D-GlcNAc-pyrophosphate polyprenol alpha-3-L-rhamnosyltransferase [Flammeovirgaceae bacterium]
MNTVAVVILNYNGSNFLNQFLPTLIKYSGQAEIVVADNKSTDDSLKVLQSFPSVTTIELPENYGYAGGYNEALKQVDATYYALVNSDIEVTDGWLNPLIQFLDDNTAYAAVQPKILDYNRRNFFEYAGAAGGFLDPLGYPYCRGRVFDYLEEDQGQYNSNLDIFWSTGACFVIRSKTFHELNGFPADFFAHMEEIDLCWRILSSEQKIACIPQSTVYHVGGGTLNKTSPRKTYLNFRNNIRLIIRNTPKWRLVYLIPIRVALDWVAAFLFWKNESFKHFAAVFSAHLDALKSLRADLSHNNRSFPGILNHKGMILFKYYLGSKNEYRRL